MVNSSPGAGLKFEPSATFEDAKAALAHAESLALRRMRQIKIRDTESGQVFDAKGLRQHIAQAQGAGRDQTE